MVGRNSPPKSHKNATALREQRDTVTQWRNQSARGRARIVNSRSQWRTMPSKSTGHNRPSVNSRSNK
jgi:hypothetical protein